MHYRALVFGTRLIRHGDRADLLLKATPSQPHRDAAGDCELWRYCENGTTTTFTVRAKRIVSIEQRVADSAVA